MKIVVNSNVVNYMDIGDKEKPTLVFLHGWLDNLNTFKELSNLLLNDFRLVLVDLPGHGESSIASLKYNLSDYVDFMEGFTSKINVLPFAYIGHSFGCRILIKGFGEKKINAEKLILIGAAGIKESRSFKNVSLYIVGKFLKFILSLPIARRFQHTLKDYLYSLIGSDYRNSSHLNQIYKNIINEDLQKYAKKISSQTLLIYGEKDTSTPTSYGKIFKTLIKNSKLEIVKDASHFVHKERPVEVVKLIKEFVS